MDQPPPQPPQPPRPTQDLTQGQQGYGGRAPQIQKTNGMAIAALISGIVGLVICFGIGSIAALIFGYVARGQIKRSQGQEAGNGMAVAGIVMGWIGVVLSLIFVAFLAAGSIALFSFAQSDELKDVVDDGVVIIPDASVEDARCSAIKKYRNQGQKHINEGETARYNSNPPTSGPHYDVPAELGFYEPDSGIEPERLVHNLEHGQIVIWYRPGAEDLDGALEEQVREFVAQEPNATVGAPFPGMDDGYNIVITSWTRARACVHASQEVVDDFRRQFQGVAPEPLTPPFKG